MLATEEIDPEPAGDVELVDAETGHRVEVSLTAGAVAEYRRLAGTWADEVAQRCVQAGAAYTRVMATDDLEPLVLGAWRRSGVLR